MKLIKHLTRKFRLFPGHDEGMAAIEMAFIFPVMLVLYFGLVDVTNLLSANRRVTLASSTMADLVTQAPGSISVADINGFYKAIQPIMDPFPSDVVGVQLFNYRKVGSAIQRVWHHDNGKSCGPTPSPSEVSSLDKLMTAGNDIVIARVCINLEPLTGKIIGSAPYNLNDQLALRPRQSVSIACATCPQN